MTRSVSGEGSGAKRRGAASAHPIRPKHSHGEGTLNDGSSGATEPPAARRALPAGGAAARQDLPRQAGDHPPDDHQRDRRRAHGAGGPAGDGQVGADPALRQPGGRALLRVPADALHRAQRALRPGGHEGLSRGGVPQARGGDAAPGRDRVHGRGLQGQQRDPQLAADPAQRAALRQRRQRACVPPAQRLRRLQRGAQRRQPAGGLRPLPAARAQRQPRLLPLPQPGQPRHRPRAASAHRRGRPDQAGPHQRASAHDPQRLQPVHGLFRGVPHHLQGADLPDPLRGDQRQRPPPDQADQALRRQRAVRRAEHPLRRRLLRAQAHLEQPRPGRDPRRDRLAGD